MGNYHKWNVWINLGNWVAKSKTERYYWNLLGMGITRGPTKRILQYYNMLSIVILRFFFAFFNYQLFSQSKTLSTASVSSKKIKFSVYSSHFNTLFYFIFLHFFNDLTRLWALSTIWWTEKSIDLYYSITQKVEFVFATFIKHLCNKILILYIFQCRHAKYRKSMLYWFYSPPLKSTKHFFQPA